MLLYVSNNIYDYELCESINTIYKKINRYVLSHITCQIPTKPVSDLNS